MQQSPKAKKKKHISVLQLLGIDMKMLIKYLPVVFLSRGRLELPHHITVRRFTNETPLLPL